MFERVAEQFNQFIASRTSSLPLSFSPLHDSSNNATTFPSFDLYITNHQVVPLQQPSSFLQPLQQYPPTSENEEKEESSMVAMDLEMGGDRMIPGPVDHQWSNDEVLALLRIRSSMENCWFPDFSWEHVSRKLAEIGFRRSAQNCKEKFEEESRFFNANINRPLSELEELYYHGDQNSREVAAENSKKPDKPSEEEEDKIGDDSRSTDHQAVANNPTEDKAKKSNSKKRKREREKFEMFKAFCEGIVNKLMAQQEEVHNKLIEDMMIRDEEKAAREEAWKKQEMERIQKELELRAHEQALASDRQSTLIKFLQKFTPSSAHDIVEAILSNCSNPSTSSSAILAQNPKGTITSHDPSQLEAPTSNIINLGHQNFSSLSGKNNLVIIPTPTSLAESQTPQNPSPTTDPSIPKGPISSAPKSPRNPNSSNSQSITLASSSLPTDKVQPKFPSNDKEDLGKRWPRDEVLALVELKCSLSNNNNEDKEGASSKAPPLWERISKGMLELGYKRSSKRCKEKWENINKYFRKTKDAKRKRSIDSRTCPYFHQLSTLYNQGMIIAPTEEPENHLASLTNHSPLPENGLTSSQYGWPVGSTTMYVVEGEENLV